MGKRNNNKRRQMLAERTKEIIAIDHSLREYNKNGKKPFADLSMEEGCKKLVTNSLYIWPNPNDFSSQNE